MDVTRIRQAVRSRLATLGVSQHALARALGVSQATLSLWLNGHREPPAGFEAAAMAELDVIEAAERAATEARTEALARGRADRTGEWRPGVRRKRHGREPARR
ncbi:MAG: helix-turn-helix transcriptional regulator [Acidobacteria bacterium]|nr:helix-turn-helix transcriptional regulator [Acidobacteriota bacterium]